MTNVAAMTNVEVRDGVTIEHILYSLRIVALLLSCTVVLSRLIQSRQKPCCYDNPISHKTEVGCLTSVDDSICKSPPGLFCLPLLI